MSEGAPLIGFNTVLKEAGIDPARVQLVRHQDSRSRPGQTPYQVWRRDVRMFELYQSMQSRLVFDEGGVLAAFVVPPSQRTLFVGLYDVGALGQNQETFVCPVRGNVHPPNTIHYYTLVRRPELRDAAGRLSIDWGLGYVNWIHRAGNKSKPVIEFAAALHEEEFPGFDQFQTRTDKLLDAPLSWRALLSAVRGVYLLVCVESGEQYVGSATGAEGFWGRWSSYAENGHGGNKLLIDRSCQIYSVSILEVASSRASDEDILRAEARWKIRLGSRAHGLNAN